MQCPHHLILVNPRDFSHNSQTASSNSFQHNVKIDDINLLVKNEFEHVLEELKKNNISFSVFDSPENLFVPDAIFPNNWFAVLPSGELIIFPMLAQNRRDEINDFIINFIGSKFCISNFIDLRSNVELFAFLEGTGSIVFDHDNKLAYAAESPRTNMSLLNGLCQQINYKPISFLAHDLKGEPIYHTNVLMSIGENTAVICLESIHNTLEREMIKQSLIASNKQVIEINYSQMNSFCANVLQVKNEAGKNVWLISETARVNFTKLQISQLTLDSEVISCDIKTIELIGGGGLRCMLAGIHASLK